MVTSFFYQHKYTVNGMDLSKCRYLCITFCISDIEHVIIGLPSDWDLDTSSVDLTIARFQYHKRGLNSLWIIDPIWWQKSGSTMAQVMACCLTTPIPYLTNVDLSLGLVVFIWVHFFSKWPRYLSWILVANFRTYEYRHISSNTNELDHAIAYEMTNCFP